MICRKDIPPAGLKAEWEAGFRSISRSPIVRLEQVFATHKFTKMILPPHIETMLAGLRTRRDVPESLFEMFEALKSLDAELPLEERWYRWEAAIDELRRYVRRG